MATIDKRKNYTVHDGSPLYAVAGAVDAAVATLRHVPSRVSVLQDRVVTAQKDVQARVVSLPQDVVTLRTEVPARLKALVDQAQDTVSEASEDVTEQYVELSVRGKDLVSRIRRQAATERLEDQARTTVRQAKAARTTARKSAESTKRATKAAVTSASKTAEAAVEATEAAAEKIGD